MFKENFIRLCNKIGKSPTAVCKDLDLSNSVYTQWTETSVPRKATLMKIADYFNVSVETLIKDDNEKELPESEKLENCVVFHRDGKTEIKKLTKEQAKFLKAVIDSMDDDTPEYL